MLRHYYGLTLDAYEALLKDQGGVCALCGEPFVEAAGQRLGPAVDHDHTTGKIRGVIHGLCNTRLGRFNDDEKLLQKAIDYLRKSR